LNLRKTLSKIWQKTRDALALIVLLATYHGNEALAYVAGNMFPYYQAIAIYVGGVSLVSLGLIYLHDYLKKRHSWDALKLQYLNSLSEEKDIPSYRVFKKLVRLVLREGFWAIFIFGPIILGPFVITVLLRKRKTWRINVGYAVCGAFFNALFWVSFMRGLGVFTWRYIAPWGGSG
jgi:cytochrome c biogenesis protein CcdA